MRHIQPQPITDPTCLIPTATSISSLHDHQRPARHYAGNCYEHEVHVVSQCRRSTSGDGPSAVDADRRSCRGRKGRGRCTRRGRGPSTAPTGGLDGARNELGRGEGGQYTVASEYGGGEYGGDDRDGRGSRGGTVSTARCGTARGGACLAGLGTTSRAGLCRGRASASACASTSRGRLRQKETGEDVCATHEIVSVRRRRHGAKERS
ncbi:hypothetical protein C8T65DRAFT_626802 [Cerioporus squamosus]|nr:hypothetical protein C8T65DRAFT_626802 [Cerioporus squamosus]